MLSPSEKGGLGAFFKEIWRNVVEFRRSLILALGIIVGAIALVNGGYYVASAKPSSCLVCHYMQPHYDTWLNSAHKDVGCIECHPGRRTLIDSYMLRYITGTYHAQPFPDVKANACLKCHDEKSLAGEITYKRGIKFNHEHHLGQLRRGKKLRCTACHATGQAGEHFAVDNEACFLCHFKDADKGRSYTTCNACHGIPQGKVEHKGFSFNHSEYVGPGIECNSCHTVVASGNGDVPDKKCYECHIERFEAKQDLNALHRIHISEHGVDCFRCHDRIDHGKIEMAPAFELDCNKCHQPQHGSTVQLYIGTGGESVQNTPSAMFTARVSCEACHASPTGKSATWAEKKAACVKCHGAGFDRMLDDWKRDFDRLTVQSESVVQQAERLAKSLPENRMTEREELRKARINADLLKDGLAVHNPFYSLKLAGQICSAADTIARAVGATKPQRPDMISRTDASCRTCHNAMPFPETLKFERMNFPHAVHSDALEISCSKCHSVEHHRQQVITKAECMQCHHKEAEISCAHCHYEQNALYTGVFPELGIKNKPDPMSTGGVGCKDCHNLTSGKPARDDVKDQCVACHDESYGRMLAGWLEKQDGLLDGVRSRLDSTNARGPNSGVDSVAWSKSLNEARGLLELLVKAKAPHNRVQFEKTTIRIDAILNSTVSPAAGVNRGDKQ